jgi:hypothetical protein
MVHVIYRNFRQMGLTKSGTYVQGDKGHVRPDSCLEGSGVTQGRLIQL